MEFGSFMEFHARPRASQAEAFAESFAHADMAEDLGLDGVWLAETHFSPGRSVLSAPLIVAAAIAGRTRRLRIGTAVHVLPLGNPLRTAEETATLDHVCGGRFEFGIGRSALPGAYEGYNTPYRESRERFFEYLEIIVAAWTHERFSYEGRFFSFKDVCLVPKPYQMPHPPIRVAATSDDTFPRLGQMGLPIFIGLRSAGLPQVAAQVRSYQAAWRSAGHLRPVDVSLRLPVYVAETKAKALSEPEESFMRQFSRLGGQLARSVASAGPESVRERAERSQELSALSWEQVQGEKVAVGTPEMVVDRLQELRERLSLRAVLVEFNAGELLPRDGVERSLRLFCEEVMPAFK